MHECFDQIESNAKRKMALRVGAAFFVSNQHFWGYAISFSTLGPRSRFEFSELQMGD
jgi:hypothetical protein